MKKATLLVPFTVAILTSCGGGSSDNTTQTIIDSGITPTTTTTANTYSANTSVFCENAGSLESSSVSYTGQTVRHALIKGLKNFIANENFSGTKEEIEAKLLQFYTGGTTSNDNNIALRNIDFSPSSDSQTFDQISYSDISSNKELASKTAGQDTVTDFKEWNNDNNFKGFTGVNSPKELIEQWISQLAQSIESYTSSGGYSISNETLNPYVDRNTGLDYQQLIDKFLLMSITFAQGTDDYLDTDIDGKGTLSNNTDCDSEAYTNLEHQWDEGFGYFGASRDYLTQTLSDIKAAQQKDTNNDSSIDLTAEYNFGASVNAAKRDVGSNNQTNFAENAMNAFIAGRALINQNAGDELTSAQQTELNTYAYTARKAWEGAIAATVIHYINDTIADYRAFTNNEDNFSFNDLAKHWAEMKGFALGLQFNPISPFNASSSSEQKFTEMHELMKNAPLNIDGLASDDIAIANYIIDLESTRDIMKNMYSDFTGFDVTTW